jgi:hypothetical protein
MIPSGPFRLDHQSCLRPWRLWDAAGVSDTGMAAVQIGGVVLAAGLGYAAGYFQDRRHTKQAAAKAAEEKKASDARIAEAENRARDANKRALLAVLHAEHAEAKTWLRGLPAWGERLADPQLEMEIRREAAVRGVACHRMWDNALGEVHDLPNVSAAIDEVDRAAQTVLLSVQSGENLTPDVSELREALARFRETVNSELGMHL